MKKETEEKKCNCDWYGTGEGWNKCPVHGNSNKDEMETKGLDKPIVRILRKTIQEILDKEKQFINMSCAGDYVIRMGNATFTESNATFKIEVSLVGKNGEIKTKDAEAFKSYARIYGLQEEDFGKTFRNNGHTYKIAGLKTKSGKYPVIAEREDGKKFKFGVEYIQLQKNKNNLI